MDEIIESVEPTYEWGDMYLKFSSEADATAALEGYPGSIDVIGTIYKQGQMMTDADGNEYPVAEATPGWHVNVRGPMLPELEQYSVTVETPVRVWA